MERSEIEAIAVSKGWVKLSERGASHRAEYRMPSGQTAWISDNSCSVGFLFLAMAHKVDDSTP